MIHFQGSQQGASDLLQLKVRRSKLTEYGRAAPQRSVYGLDDCGVPTFKVRNHYRQRLADDVYRKSSSAMTYVNFAGTAFPIIWASAVRFTSAGNAKKSGMN
jgi:hypothetical protein